MNPSVENIHPIVPRKSVILYKRLVDIIIGFSGMTILTLLFPIIALAIKIDSKGPVLYKQARVGKNRRDKERRSSAPGKILPINDKRKNTHDRRRKDYCGNVFTMYKFRTMKVNAEENGPQLCSEGFNDPRITKVGSWLRFLHMDELPQFWNILIGEMSLMGPRPERPFFAEKYINEIPYYLERMRFVKPGLTGLAQITLGYDKSLQTVTYKYYYDLTYRIAMTSFSSWIRMESWIFLNTIRYMWSQICMAKLLRNRIFRIKLNQVNGKSRKAPETIHIAHPWKLIERINERQKKSGRKIPSFLENFEKSEELMV
jgi:lipopolysaccharide/colanic/teichoic acid biosynthesis glycosyltransferase